MRHTACEPVIYGLLSSTSWYLFIHQTARITHTHLCQRPLQYKKITTLIDTACRTLRTKTAHCSRTPIACRTFNLGTLLRLASCRIFIAAHLQIPTRLPMAMARAWLYCTGKLCAPFTDKMSNEKKWNSPYLFNIGCRKWRALTWIITNGIIKEAVCVLIPWTVVLS